MLVLVSAELLSLPTVSKQPCPQGWTIKQAKTGVSLKNRRYVREVTLFVSWFRPNIINV